MRRFFMAACVATLMAAPGAAMAGEWVSLFDGESLDGWTVTTDNPDSFLVEDGVLIARGGPAHLFYTGDVNSADFGNFELKLKVMTTPGSNSGVYFHTRYQAEGWPEAGYEAQVNSTQADPRKTGSLYGIADMYVTPADEPAAVVRFGNGDIFVHREAAPSVDGQWFDYHIKVEGKTITIMVDGEATAIWTEPDDWADEHRKLGHGTFALQAHDPDSEIHYQDIFVKVLD